jgi:hypothetical protein
MPIQVYSKTTKRRVQEALIGVHHFVLNGREREMAISHCVVLMEGAAALAAFGRPDPVPQYVLDSGGRTTELYRTIGMKADRRGCAGVNIGVEVIGDELNRWFVSSYDRELSQREIQAILTAHARHEALPTIYARGQQVQLDGKVATIVEAIGARLDSEIKKVWRTSETGSVAGDAATALFIGGGTYYFAKRIRETIPFIEIPSAPENANAIGCKALADSLTDEEWEILGLVRDEAP